MLQTTCSGANLCIYVATLISKPRSITQTGGEGSSPGLHSQTRYALLTACHGYITSELSVRIQLCARRLSLHRRCIDQNISVFRAFRQDGYQDKICKPLKSATSKLARRTSRGGGGACARARARMLGELICRSTLNALTIFLSHYSCRFGDHSSGQGI